MAKPIFYLFNGKVAKFGNSVLGTIPPDVYTITIGTSTNGSISSSAQSSVAGQTITLTSTPDQGYILDYFTVNGVAIVGNTFTMPSENVTVAGVFQEEPSLFIKINIGTQTMFRFDEMSVPEWLDAKTGMTDSISSATDLNVGENTRRYIWLTYPYNTTTIRLPSITTGYSIPVATYSIGSSWDNATTIGTENISPTDYGAASRTLTVPEH